MRRQVALILCAFGSFPLACYSQQTSPTLPDAPAPSVHNSTSSHYSPPTQSERFNIYVRGTYSFRSLIEAGVHAGINQARDSPSGWPEGAEGYGDRFGSAAGVIIIRGTTEYAIGAALKEDLRIRLCRGCDFGDKAKTALQDTFTARKGEDGHRAFSFARIVGPSAGGLVATHVWYPAGYGSPGQSFREIGVGYGLVFGRNLVREVFAH